MEEEQVVPRSAFVGAALALTVAAAAGLFGLHRPRNEDVAQLYNSRRGLAQAGTRKYPPSDHTPAALDDTALALDGGGQTHH